ncbi:MAG: hypothetical protein MUQ26_05590, partial [Armatimonadetes bacterium]|nr:hypothetical protein [Armatimonadota bacterium]
MRIVVVFYIFLAGSYAIGVPPGRGPDESAHVRYIQYLGENHRLPVFDAENPDPDYEFHQPPLYYALSLPVYLLAGGGAGQAERGVRFFTLLMALALVYLTFALARALAPEKPWVAVASAGVVAFLPMHLSVVSSVSNDALTEIWSAAALVLLVRYLHAASTRRAAEPERPLGPGLMIAAGAMIGLGMLTNSISALLFPVAWAAAALAARHPGGYRWRQMARDVALATGAALILSGWWLVRSQLLYGDLLAQRAFLDAFEGLRPSPQDQMARYDGVFAPNLHLGIYLQVVITWTFASMLGVFGPKHGNAFIFYPYWIYLAYGVVGLAGAVGFARYAGRAKLADWQRQAWLICFLFGILL